MNITNKHAIQTLVESNIVKNLAYLNLSHNLIKNEGV